MRFFYLFFSLILPFTNQDSGIFISKGAKITIFSSAPIEDIKAVSAQCISVYNSQTNELEFSVPIRSFQFDKALMQEHFNDDYMESEKYPKALFKGKIVEKINTKADNLYKVMVSGELTIHGVKNECKVPGTLNIKDGAINMMADFDVKCADYNIKIPQIAFYHIAESIKVKISANYQSINNKSK